jgi:MurNAc alpha-1-phosphate uridylyltransferase
MRINTAFILCAGFGKRLNPLTLETPKPLIKLNNIAVLETCINLIENLGIQQIILNTFYLKDQIHDFINYKKFNSKITIIDDGENILDTGGGISNMMKHTNEENVLIFNPDTIWEKNYSMKLLKWKIYIFQKN